MGSVSPTMAAVLTAMQRGDDYHVVNGKTVRSTTLDALERRGLLERSAEGMPSLTERGHAWTTGATAENIDQPRSTTRFVIRWADHWTVTFDVGETDHKFWDRARRGEAQGLEIAGLFLKPLASKKAAWVLGQMPQITSENPTVETQVAEWFEDNHADVVLALEEAANLGDMYVVVNPDLTVTVVPPHVVEPIVDDKDYSQHVGWRITQTFAHPSDPMKRQTVIDEFTRKERRRIVQQNGQTLSTKRYRNLLGVLPIVHIPNNQRANEIFGHPEGEALLKALFHYNEIFKAGIEGNIKQGRPTPAFTKMGSAANVQKFMEALGRKKVDPETQDEYYELDFTSDDAVIIGEDGQFSYESPGSFTADTKNLLGLLFYLIVQHSEMPEFIFGNAIQGSRASAETQLPPFIKWIEKEQGRAAKWLRELLTVVVGYISLFEVGVAEDDTFKIIWPALSEADGQLTLQTVQWAYTSGLLADEVALSQLTWLDIEDPAGMLKDLQRQRDEARQRDEQPFVPDVPDDRPDSEEPEAEDVEETLLESIIAEAHTGVMAAFEIPADAATTLANATRQSGIEPVPPDDMHLTLAFLDEMAAIADQREAVEAALTTFASLATPVEGTIGGTGRFNASMSSGDRDVIYASFDSPALPEFRQALVAAIEGAGVEISRTHGFTPHITLAYVEPGTAMPNLALETTALHFDTLVLAWGDERKTFSLQATGAAQDDPDEQKALATT